MKFKEGDAVQHSVRWIRTEGGYTPEIMLSKGKIVSIDKDKGTGMEIATVDWGDHVSSVHVYKLWKTGVLEPVSMAQKGNSRT